MEYNNNKQAITGSQAKEADRIAIFERGIDSLTLMENASACVTEYIVNNSPHYAEVLIISGVGNNGADGICIGKQLIGHGYKTKVVIVGNLEKAGYEFFHQLSEYKRLNGEVAYYKENTVLNEVSVLTEDTMQKENRDTHFAEDCSPTILVDAIFGIGLHREVVGLYRLIIEQADSLNCKKIAVDVPSGINADDGALMGAGIHADVTITFGRNKVGLMEKNGPEYSGQVIVCDIGIPNDIYDYRLEI